MERGVALSRQYGVDRVLQPIFDYMPTADSPPLAPKHITAPPARPKKKNLPDDSDNSTPVPKAQSSRVQATKAAAAKKAAENRKAAEERKREESEEEHANLMREMGSDGRSLSNSEGSDQSETPSPFGSEMGDAEYQDFNNGNHNGNGSRKRKHGDGMNHQNQQNHQQQQQSNNNNNNSHLPMHNNNNNHNNTNLQQSHLPHPHSHSHPSHQQQQQQHSQQQQQHQQSVDSYGGGNGGGPLRYARLILDYFVSETNQVPSFLTFPPADFDANVVIDDDGHTALHWACAMGRLKIVRLLLSAGADVFRANGMGQTALMRSVMFTNNYDLRKFPELFELLHRSTINIDRNDRTVFHYVVDIALQKGKTHAARYYIETILARLVDYPQEVADILNFQDEEGETALTLAARARSKRLVKILLDNGADPKISNRDGKTAEDYILEDERFRESDVTMGGTGPLLMNNGVGDMGGASGSNSNGLGAYNNSNYPHPQHHQLLSNSSIPSFVPQLHTSETGQRTSSKSIPQVAQLLEQLATSFDKELGDTDRDLQQAVSLLSTINTEIHDSNRILNNLDTQASTLDQLSSQESNLVLELELKMGKRFRLGWEKWVRDEDAREISYINSGPQSQLIQPELDLDHLIDLSRNLPLDYQDQVSRKRARVGELIEERKELFGVLARLESSAGTGIKPAQYRQLIALGCGVPIEQVEQVVESL